MRKTYAKTAVAVTGVALAILPTFHTLAAHWLRSPLHR